MSIKLYQLSLDQSVVNCGMSYVFKLEKGEFFIIDGGYFTEGEAERLYSFLRQGETNPNRLKKLRVTNYKSLRISGRGNAPNIINLSY